MRELDAMGHDEVTSALAPLFEGAPRFVERIAADRPYGTYDAMLERARVICLTMPEEEQLELLGSHPRIGAPRGSVSELSHREQGYDRPPQLDVARVDETLQRLNEEYEQRFGFRFVVFVAGRPREEIAEILRSRLEADREEEKERGLRDVIAIAGDRLRRLGSDEVWEEGP